HTFQIADGQAQQIRMSTINNNFVLTYGDATATNILEYGLGGNLVASIVDPTSVAYSQVEIFQDGRIGVAYSQVVDANETSQVTSKIFDLRTAGLSIDDTNLHDHIDKDFAGTRFDDSVVGESSVNNIYYFVGDSTSGPGPVDSFTGGSGGWNI